MKRGNIYAMTPLEKELEIALLDLHRKWGTIGYHANYFKRMLTNRNPRYYKGPVGTVRHLLSGPIAPASGFNRLVQAGKTNWTVEALLQDDKWKHLFGNAELLKARARLRQAGS
jgi:hypothetical protein